MCDMHSHNAARNRDMRMMRGAATRALHSHTLVWCKKKTPANAWTRLDALPRSAPGSESRQRLPTFKVDKLKDFQWDTVCQRTELGEISAEMVRADVSGSNWAGHTWETLRVCGFGRSILRNACVHTCTPGSVGVPKHYLAIGQRKGANERVARLLPER